MNPFIPLVGARHQPGAMDMEALTRLLYGLNSYPLTPYNVLLRYFLIAKISNRIYFNRSAWHTPKHLKKVSESFAWQVKKRFLLQMQDMHVRHFKRGDGI